MNTEDIRARVHADLTVAISTAMERGGNPTDRDEIERIVGMEALGVVVRYGFEPAEAGELIAEMLDFWRVVGGE